MKITAYFFKLTVVVLFACLLSQVSSAQSFKDDLVRINQVYAKLTYYSLNIRYVLYSDAKSIKPYEIQKAKVQFENGNQLYTQGETEVLTTHQYIVSINNAEKTISVRKAVKHKPVNLLPVNLDSINRFVKSIDILKPDSVTSAYSLYIKGGEYERIDIYFNKKSYVITKIVLYYRNYADTDKENKIGNKPRIEIVYSDLDTSDPSPGNELSESKYVNIKGNNAFTQPKYRSYKTTSYLNLKH